jgi:glycosyltransferase involved in cell wall biosynthesis
VKIVTEAHEVAPEVLNLWTQPLVYRDREHLFEAFPESDIVLATWWVTSHRYMRELRRRYDFVAGYYIQDYETLFYPEHEVEARHDAVLSYRWADHHVYASQWIADHVGPEAAAKSVVIPLDVDLDVFYPRGNRTEGRPRVVSVAAPGVERRRRGFPETAEAFRLIHEARPDVELVFFGADASEMPELPFPYTNMGRLYDQNRVADLVSSADVLVDASLWQGFGRPGLEAMACGTVPVLTGVGGLFEYAREGENCLLTPSGDAAAVAASALRLLEDRDLYDRLASDGVRTAQGFSHKLIAARHLETYRRWVRERNEGD